MGKKEDRRAITESIIVAAKEYKNQLVGKSFLYIFDNRYIEVVYRVRDFAHMTGVGTTLSGTDLYKEAIRGTLKENQIFFSPRHPYDLSRQKVKWVKNLPLMMSSDLMILENISTNSVIYNFGMTENNFTLCLDEDRNAKSLRDNRFYIVRSLRIDNCFDKADYIYPVDFILKKENDAKVYSELLYKRNDGLLNELPDHILKKIKF